MTAAAITQAELIRGIFIAETHFWLPDDEFRTPSPGRVLSKRTRRRAVDPTESSPHLIPMQADWVVR